MCYNQTAPGSFFFGCITLLHRSVRYHFVEDLKGQSVEQLDDPAIQILEKD